MLLILLHYTSIKSIKTRFGGPPPSPTPSPDLPPLSTFHQHRGTALDNLSRPGRRSGPGAGGGEAQGPGEALQFFHRRYREEDSPPNDG